MRYAALAVFLTLRTAFFVTFTSAFLFAAHLRRIRSEAAFRWAAVNLRPCFLGAGAAAAARGFFGGRPRRFVGPWRASIARLSLSRSWTRRARICSVGIEKI